MADTEAATRAANERLQLERNLAEAGQKAGIDDRATQDYVNRGLQVWKIKDGKVVAIKDGEPLFSKQKPAEMMTMEEWALELQSEAPHLYKPSRGGGAAANGSGGNGGGGREHKKVISSDPLEFGRNLEGLARGDVIVQQ
jgi:hypothetical protein